MGAQNTRRSSETADAIDILRAIAVAQAAAAATITLPVPPAGTPGDEPASRTTPAVDEEPPGQAGRASAIPPSTARPADTIDTGGDAGGPPATATASPPGRHRHAHAKTPPLFAGACRAITSGPWPLTVILTVQAGLSLRLVWANTAFSDEALYLWAGHLEWAHWLHGTPVPNFAAYFSGAPVVYPPLGALADSVGGLAGARILSLFFMLGATTLLYDMTRRLFGRRAAILAAGLFTGTAAAQFLGAFATYDAMALVLLALATWLGARAADLPEWGQVPMLLASGMILAVADAAKYASVLFDPVILAVVALIVWHRADLKKAVSACVIMACSLGVSILLAVDLAGPNYWRGITWTTLTRASDNASAIGILEVGVGWVAIAAFLALIGVVTATVTKTSLPLKLCVYVLACAVILAPVSQARIHVFTSLFKHVGYGAWFAAVIGGYALAAFADAIPKSKAAGATLVAIGGVCASLMLASLQAGTHFHVWPNTARMVAAMRPVLQKDKGDVLADDNGNVLDYYLPSDLHGIVFSGTWFFRYEDPQTGQHLFDQAAYADAIRHRFFSAVMLSFSDAAPTDAVIRRDLIAYGGYRLDGSFPYQTAGTRGAFQVWVRAGA